KNTFHIDFKPHHHLFKTGNEPVYMIRELAELGALETHAFQDVVPDITILAPEDCFLSWRFFLTTDKEQRCIEEIFDWVEDDA
ncbi:chemotaxis protein CheA, partial [Pseudoalteromonas sp. S1650]